MNRVWLVIDSDYIAARAFYSTGQLTEGVLFGFFRAVAELQDRHNTEFIAFCFDHGRPKRASLHEGYKAARQVKREAMTEEERQSYTGYKRQKQMLRDEYLRRLGYRNVFAEPGYEADDCIASVVRNLPEGDTAVMVSSDHDLYQLIGPRIKFWNPANREMITLQSFVIKYGIRPGLWPDVKAMAGCTSDDIPGIPGVGEKTAAKFMSHRIPLESKTYQKITNNSDIWQRNLELVRLPYPGCPRFRLHQDRVTLVRWERLMNELGMPSLRRLAPVGTRATRGLVR